MDTLDAMRIFARVVEAEGFSAAARKIGISKALVSKSVSQLEERLGVRLLNRTTRRLSVTEVGQAYYRRACDIIGDVEELETAVTSQHVSPQGRLRVTGPQSFGERRLVPALDGFLAEYPAIDLDLVLADRHMDLVDEGLDVAIRIANLPDSSLIARKLSPSRVVLCGAPDYLDRAGRPEQPADLAKHRCLLDSNFRNPSHWQFRDGDDIQTVTVSGRLQVNSAPAVRTLAVCGYGLALCPYHEVAEDIRAGRLEILMAEREAYEQACYALYPYNRRLSGKVRVFVDYLIQHFRDHPLVD